MTLINLQPNESKDRQNKQGQHGHIAQSSHRLHQSTHDCFKTCKSKRCEFALETKYLSCFTLDLYNSIEKL